jgi:hypothetical protein
MLDDWSGMDIEKAVQFIQKSQAGLNIYFVYCLVDYRGPVLEY